MVNEFRAFWKSSVFGDGIGICYSTGLGDGPCSGTRVGSQARRALAWPARVAIGASRASGAAWIGRRDAGQVR